jgi:hypothetical protein
MKKALILVILTFGLFRSITNAQDTEVATKTFNAKCGDIIEGEFSENYEEHSYGVEINAGDALDISVVPIGSSLQTWIVLRGPTNIPIVTSDANNNISGNTIYSIGIESQSSIRTEILSARGTHKIVIGNYNYAWGYGASGGVGVYTLYVGCTLRDGTVIEAGDVISDTEGSSSTPTPPPFSGFGLPPLPAVDFSTGIEIPITLGQPQTAPVAGDLVALYTYTASEGETRTLSLSRASGNLSIGVTVIKKENNEIVFLGGMPSSNNLSVELTFPSAGDYVIGLFVLNTSTLTGSSGAVTVRLD